MSFDERILSLQHTLCLANAHVIAGSCTRLDRRTGLLVCRLAMSWNQNMNPQSPVMASTCCSSSSHLIASRKALSTDDVILPDWHISNDRPGTTRYMTYTGVQIISITRLRNLLCKHVYTEVTLYLNDMG